MIGYLEHHIVDHCNLNCTGCSHFSPLVKEPWFEDLEDFKRDFTQLASQTNVRIIRLMGGEPLLHPQVGDFLKVAHELFPDSELQLVTNGLLLPQRKNELMNLCNELHILICVSNYHLNFDLNEALKGFLYTRIDEKGQLYNISLELSGTQNYIESFNNCDLHINHWYYFQGGRFYPCCISANIHYFNEYFPNTIDNCADNETSISVYDHSVEEIEQFLNQPFKICRYCNTIQRQKTYNNFHVSKRGITEWTCQ